MRIKVSNKQKNNVLNITVRVKGFEEKGDQVGVQGVNVLTGEEATFWLTTQGKRAENDSRESLLKLRDGIKRGRDDVRKLEVGGLVSFKSAFPKKGEPNQYWSTWANVLAYNAADAKKYVDYGKAAILTMHDYKDFFDENIPDSDKKRPWGKLTIYNDKSESHIIGNQPDDLFDKTAEYANQIKTPAFLIRYLDANNGVLGFSSFWNNYSKEEGRGLTAPEVAAALVENVTENLKNYSACRTINVVPGRRYSVSMKQLRSTEAKENKLKLWCSFASYFYKKTVYQNETYFDFYCRELFAKIGGDNNAFVNGIQFVNPNPDAFGIDPVLIGGLQYSAEIQAEMAEGQEERASAPPEEKPPQRSASPTFSAEQTVPMEKQMPESQEPSNETLSEPVLDDPFSCFTATSLESEEQEDPFKDMGNSQKEESSLPPQNESFPFGDMDTGFDGRF